MYRYLLFALTLSVFACEKTEQPKPATTVIEPQVFIRGEIREPEQSDFVPFDITVGKKDEPLRFLFWGGYVSESELGGEVYIGGAYSSNVTGRPYWGLQLWQDVPSEKGVWTQEQIESIFEPGTVFPFGKGAGKVDLLLRVPLDSVYNSNNCSRPSYLADPEGALEVIGLEPLDYELFTIGNNHSYGMLVHCVFSGQLGRHDYIADGADGNPNFYQTDDVVELRNGELTFYIEYRRE